MKIAIWIVILWCRPMGVCVLFSEEDVEMVDNGYVWALSAFCVIGEWDSVEIKAKLAVREYGLI